MYQNWIGFYSYNLDRRRWASIQPHDPISFYVATRVWRTRECNQKRHCCCWCHCHFFGLAHEQPNHNTNFIHNTTDTLDLFVPVLSKLCFQWLVRSGKYEIMAIHTDKKTFFNDLDYEADIGQHFHKSKKSARWHHHYKIIKTNSKTIVSSLLTRPQGCQKMHQDPLNMPVEVWWTKIATKLKNIWKYLRKQAFFDIFLPFWWF